MKEQLVAIKYENSILHLSTYLQQGGGDWIICLHGLQSNKKMFDDLLKQPFMHKYNYLVVDFIGFGNSDKPEQFVYDIENQTRAILRLIELLQIRKFNLIGHSLGGMVGTLLLSKTPASISSFINMEGNLVLADCGPSRAVSLSPFADFCNKQFQILKDEVQQKQPKRSSWLEDIPDFVFYQMSRSIVDWSTREKLVPYFIDANCPRLFIYGDQNHRKASVISENSEIHCSEIPNSGHFMLLDNPQACYTAIEEFLDQAK